MMLETRKSSGEPHLCDLCQIDSFVDDAHKEKLWDNRYQLERHVASTFHNGFSTLCWKFEFLHAPGETYNCPYGCGKKYKDMHNLKELIRNPLSDADARRAPNHDYLKRQDGWYCDDWEINQMSDEKKAKRKLYTNIEIRGVVSFPQRKYLEPHQYEIFKEPTLRMWKGHVVQYRARTNLDELYARAQATAHIDPRPLEEKLAEQHRMWEEAQKNSAEAEAKAKSKREE